MARTNRSTKEDPKEIPLPEKQPLPTEEEMIAFWQGGITLVDFQSRKVIGE